MIWYTDEVKICNKCHKEKSLSEFSSNKHHKDGKQISCKTCYAEYQREWCNKNREKVRAKVKRSNRKSYLRNTAYIIDYLQEHSCKDCGENDIVVLQFDHMRDKKLIVTDMLNYSLEVLIAEIEKCEVVCANDHIRRTSQRARTYRILALG